MSMESTKRPPKPQQPKLIKHVAAAKQPEVQELTNSDAQVKPYQDVAETPAIYAVPKTVAQSTESVSKPTEKQELFSPTPDDGKLLEELTTEQQPGHAPINEKPLEPPKVEPQVTSKRNKKKIDSQPAAKPHIPFQNRSEEPELPPEPCQHNAISGLQLGGRACDIRVLPLQFGDNQRVHRRSCNGRVQRTTFGDFHKGKMP